ncbi:hypothetical protein BH10CHL1_BH10CHL1_38480 [soil metagenome]
MGLMLSGRILSAFKLSDETKQRANTLLVKERTQGVTEDEAKELDYYVDLGDFLGILRAKAQLQLHANIS